MSRFIILCMICIVGSRVCLNSLCANIQEAATPVVMRMGKNDLLQINVRDESIDKPHTEYTYVQTIENIPVLEFENVLIFRFCGGAICGVVAYGFYLLYSVMGGHYPLL